MPKLGLIAGNRTFPLHVARAARSQGYEVVAIGLKEETDAALEREVQRIYWVSLKEVGNVPVLLKKEGVQELILAGQIKPERILQSEEQLDLVTRSLLKLLPDRRGNSLMKLAVHYLESQGFRVLDSGTFLKEWIPVAGVLTQRSPTEEERADVSYGIPLALQCARWGIGQTIVVRKKTVVSVEGMEGTDATIRRAGEISGPGCVVVKACGVEHDMRFDIPVVGVETIRAMDEVGASCLGVEAKRTLLFERPTLIAEADRQGIAIIAL